MKLRDLLKDIPILSATADLELEIPNVSYDSRETRPGDLFGGHAGLCRRRPRLHRQGGRRRCRRSSV